MEKFAIRALWQNTSLIRCLLFLVRSELQNYLVRFRKTLWSGLQLALGLGGQGNPHGKKCCMCFFSSTLTSSLCRLCRSWHYLYPHSSADFLKTSWHTALKANLSHMRSWHTVYFLLLLLLLIVNVSDAGSICWHVTCKSPLISHTLSQTTFSFPYIGRGRAGSEILMTRFLQHSPVRFIICLLFPQV